MFRRDSNTVQGLCDATVESTLDSAQLRIDTPFDARNLALDRFDFAVGGHSCFIDRLEHFLFGLLAGPDQRLDVLGAFLVDTGIGTQTGQPDLAGVQPDVGKRGGLLVFDFFSSCSLWPWCTSCSKVEGTAPEMGISTTLRRKIRMLTLGRTAGLRQPAPCPAHARLRS